MWLTCSLIYVIAVHYGAQFLSKNNQKHMHHSIAVGDMFPHYNEYGHCIHFKSICIHFLAAINIHQRTVYSSTAKNNPWQMLFLLQFE